MVKVTFTLDDGTVERLRRLSPRLAKPQSQVVREAVKDYEARAGKLTDEERDRLLAAFDRLVPKIPLRRRADTERELRQIRAARRRGGRRHPVAGEP
jgi:predicted transcriptional regulator